MPNWPCHMRAWIIWIVAAIFYAYEFFLRISPTVLTAELMRDFGISAAAVGTLSAFYYYAYASMQIPVGIMLDRYGIRRLLVFAAILVAIGSILFSFTGSLWVANLGRVFMGVGSAFSFVGCIKLATNWFPANRLAIVIGLTNMLGVFGAIGGEAPLSYFVATFGWRHTLFIAGIIGALLALLIQLIVRDSPPETGCDPIVSLSKEGEPPLLEGLKLILKSKATWLAAIYGCLLVAPIAAFTELWSVPFLMSVDNLTKFEASLVSSIVFMGIAAGGPIIGFLSGYFGTRKLFMWLGTIVAFITMMCIIFIANLAMWQLSILLFSFGFATSNMLLIFTINVEQNPHWVSGVVIGFTNMVVMFGGAIFQPLVGLLLDWQNSPTFLTTHTHSAHEFQLALVVLPCCQLVALGLLTMMRETLGQENSISDGR